MEYAPERREKQRQYEKEAKARWGSTAEYRAFEEKDRGRAPAERDALGQAIMDIFVQLGRLRQGDPAAPQAQALAGQLQRFITRHFYPCPEAVLLSLGRLYGDGGEMNRNIDRAAGEGTGEFACRAIRAFCGHRNHHPA